MRFVPASDFTEMPWKNGRGVTREVALGGDPADFDWRVSIATVAASGPFSAFAGIDRTIAVMQGEGMLLDVDGRTHELRAAGAPFAFPGEAVVHAACIGGETTDLNVMTRRGSFSHAMSRLSPTGPLTIRGRRELTLIVFNAPFRLRLDGRDHTAHALDAVCDIRAGDSLRVEPEGEGELFEITIGRPQERGARRSPAPCVLTGSVRRS